VSGSPKILVADDSEDDRLLVKLAFTEAGMRAQLEFVEDGQEAVDYLKGEGRFADRTAHPLPNLLLLDLKMPRLNGFEVIKWAREQPGLRRLIILAHTSSYLQEDVDEAYDLGANSYLVKRAGLKEIGKLALELENYWFCVNQCPPWPPTAAGEPRTRRLVLRDFDTGLFFKNLGEWSANTEDAMEFKSIPMAMTFGTRLKQKNLEVCWTGGRIEGGVRIPDGPGLA